MLQAILLGAIVGAAGPAQPDGSFVFETDCYRAQVGANGYIQSLRAGQTEFLRPYAVPEAKGPGATGGVKTGSAVFIGNRPDRGMATLDKLRLIGRRRLNATGRKATIRYTFDRDHITVVVQHKLATRDGRLSLVLSPDVVGALDGRTDRALLAEGLQTGPQLHTRLVTKTGGVLTCRQAYRGYSRIVMARLPGKVWALGLRAWGHGPNTFSLRPIASPSAPEAIGFRVESASPDFLLPGGKPVHFDITATSYAAKPVTGRFVFQVGDYLTRKPVGQKVTPFTLEAGKSMPVPTDVPINKPGPYRGTMVAKDDTGRSRQVGWVFTYDFPNYKPALTRQPDFHAFWKEALADLAKVPMDAKLTPVPEVSTKQLEAFKVNLATLNGRRVHCWYWKPRKPGKYPVYFNVPSSGVYPRKAAHVPRSPQYCGMWMAIHGLPVDYDPKTVSKDPAAWGYWTHGIASPKTSMWRVIYASMVRGVDFLCSRPEVDPKRIMVGGGSQGGGLSMVLAGLDRRIAFCAPAHSGLPRLDWTVLHKPGFWPFGMNAKPEGQTDEQFLKTLSYFDAANFTADITCPVVAEVSLLDTVTASGNQICALAHVKAGLLQLICDPWTGHASMPRGAQLRAEAIARFMAGQPPVKNPIKPK